MTFLQKLGLGKKEKTQRRPFDEMVHSSISPQSVRANELVEICERIQQQRYRRWDTPNSGFSHGPNFWDDASMALAYVGVGRTHDAKAVLRGMEYRFDGFLRDWYVCSLSCYVPVIAAYSAVEGQGRAAMRTLISRISDEKSLFHSRYEEGFESPEFALAHLAAGDEKKAFGLVQKAIRGNDTFTPTYSLTRRAMLFKNKQPDSHTVDFTFPAIQFDAYHNALFAISLYFLGEKNKAKKVVRGIELLNTDKREIYEGLILDRGARNGKHTYPKCFVAQAALLSFAHSLLDKSEAPKEMKHGPLSGHPYRGVSHHG